LHRDRHGPPHQHIRLEKCGAPGGRGQSDPDRPDVPGPDHGSGWKGPGGHHELLTAAAPVGQSGREHHDCGHCDDESAGHRPACRQGPPAT
jgi:hypothetical protein